MNLAIRIVRFCEPREFADRVVPWLEQEEAAHSILLGILPQLINGTYTVDGPLYMAVVEREHHVVGCAFRTPPFHLWVARMPEAAAEPLVEDVATMYDELPGIIGHPATAGRTADAWRLRHGGSAVADMLQGIYCLEKLRWPERLAPGTIRRAHAADGPLLREWASEFVAETRAPVHDVNGLADRLVAAGEMWVWEDGRRCCMAATTGRTANGIRLAFVYTPPERRGNGYASALVAHASKLHLDAGCRFCFLYTDLTNRTSNKIYRQLGYVRAADSVEIRFLGTKNPASAG